MAHDPRPEKDAEEDAAWRAIVDNYGERPVLDDEQSPGPEPVVTAGALLEEDDDLPSPAAPDVHDEHDEHFVPPPPPPVPVAEPRRLLAWMGLFVPPTAVLVAVVAGLHVPSWLGLLLMVWFVGGFVFLVASMGSHPRDEDDDGAVV